MTIEVNHPSTISSALLKRLHAHAQQTPNKSAFTFLHSERSEELTFQDLLAQVNGVAAGLRERVPHGERAVLLYPSGLEFIVAFLACLAAGVIAVPATTPRRNRGVHRLKAIIEDCQPSVLLTTSAIAASIEEAFPDFAHTGSLIQTDILHHEHTVPLAETLTPHDVAFLQYTSGSTAVPKGVVVTHRSLLANLECIRLGFGFTAEDVMCDWLPMFHDMGLVGANLTPIYVGMHSVRMAPTYFASKPAGWLQAITTYRATCAGAPNFGWEHCIKNVTSEDKREIDLSHLRVAYNGAEPIRAATIERFSENFRECGFRQEAFFPCYGMAEATLFVTGGPRMHALSVLHVSDDGIQARRVELESPNTRHTRALVGCGRVWGDTQVYIVDPESGIACSPDTVGEIWVSGESVAREYWGRPEQTRETFEATLSDAPGMLFLRTGDLGFLRDGELYITGRLKDLIIHNGRNIYPQDIEAVVEQVLDFVTPNSCAAFALDDNGREAIGIVIEADRRLVRIVRKSEQQINENSSSHHSSIVPEIEAMLVRVRDAVVSEFGAPVEEIVFVSPGTFPRTTSGKVQRSLCQTQIRSGGLDTIYQFGTMSSVATAPAQTTDVSHSHNKSNQIIAWLRDYAERRINSRLIDERRSIPPYIVLDFGNKGLFGLQVPKQAGGLELRVRDMLRVVEQLAAIDTTLTLMVGVHNGLGLRPIMNYGSQSVRDEFMPALATGRQFASFAMTEPGAGSNPTAMQATAMRVPGGWRVNAEKQWIGLAAWAGVITVFAKAVDEAGSPIGTIALAVPEDSIGLSQGPEAMTSGTRGFVQNTIYLQDVFVPEKQVIGDVGEGMRVAQDAMMFCRLALGSVSLGAMKRCAQIMTRYATRRTISTGALIENPVTLTRLGNLSSAITATESLVYCLADILDSGEELPVEAYLACKTSAPEYLGKAVDDLVQLLGGRGYIESNLVPQIMRDARLLRIFEGPTEALNTHLGAYVLRRTNSIHTFLSEKLEADTEADKLVHEVQEIEHATRTTVQLNLSLDRRQQWVQHEVGRLATATIVLAATKHAVRLTKREEREHAVRWAGKQVEDIRNSIWAVLKGDIHLQNPERLVDHIAAYQDSIGDIQQHLPGEEHGVDPLLTREGVALQPTLISPVLSQTNIGFTDVDQMNAINPPLSKSSVESVTIASNAVNVFPTVWECIEQTVQNWMQSEMKREIVRLDRNVSLTALGVDSLGAASIAEELESVLGVHLSPELLLDVRTAGDLAVYIEHQRKVQIPMHTEIGKNETVIQVAKPEIHTPLPHQHHAVSMAVPDMRIRTLDRYKAQNQRFEDWRQSGRYFFFPEITEQQGAWVTIDDQRMLMMGSYSYLGLTDHPDVINAGIRALQAYGSGQHGARLLAGTTTVHCELERKIAAFMNTDDAITFSSGYVTNVATIVTLVGRGNVVIGDQWNHASIVEGCRFSQAEFLTYPHNNMDGLEEALRRAEERHTLVVTDASFSMEGDIAALPRIAELCRRYNALLMMDEAHSIGVLGNTGRGICEHFGMPENTIDIKMGTLSKAFGSFGGFIAASQTIVDYLRHHAHGSMFSGALPVSLAASAKAAIEVLEREPERVHHLWRMRERFASGLRQLGIDTFGSTTPIVPIACRFEEIALEMTTICRQEGLFVTPVFYPAVPMNAPRLRTCVLASHTAEDIDFALGVIERAGRRTKLIP